MDHRSAGRPASGITLAEAASLHIKERKALFYSGLSLLRRLLEDLVSRVTSRLAPHERHEGEPPEPPEPSLADLQPEDIHAVLDDIALWRGKSTIQKAAGIFRVFGRWLFARGLVLLDPARDVAVVKFTRGLGYVPSPSDVARLLAEAEPERVLLREGPVPPRRKHRRRCSWE